MRIKKLLIRGFGKFINREIHFKDGLNIIYGENEAGKSTLHRFIEGIFFSFKKPDKSKRYWNSEQERFKPWKTNEYGGVVVYEHKGQLFRLEREFAKEKDTVRLFDENTGEDLTANFNEKPNHEREILEDQLGINPNIFKNTISVSQLGVKCGEELVQEVKTSLSNLKDTGSEEISLKSTYERIKAVRNQIGTERQKTKGHYQLLKRIEGLEQELEETKELFSSLQDSEIKLNNLRQKKAGLAKILGKKEQDLKKLKEAKLFSLYQKAREIDLAFIEIKKEAESYSYLKEFPSSRRDELLGLKEKITSLEERLNDLQIDLTDKSQEFTQQQQFIAEHDNLVGLSDHDLEGINLAFNSYQEKKRELAEMDRKKEGLKTGCIDKEKRLAAYYPGYAGLSYQQIELLNEGENRVKNNRIRELEFNLSRIEERLEGLNNGLQKKKGLILSGGIIGILALIGLIFLPWLGLGLIAGVVFLILGIQGKNDLTKKVKKLEEEKTKLRSELTVEQELLEKTENELSLILQKYGTSNLLELKGRFLDYNEEKHSLDRLKAELSKLVEKKELLKREIVIKGNEIKGYLISLEGDDPVISREMVEKFKKSLKEFLNRQEKINSLQQEITTLKEKREDFLIRIKDFNEIKNDIFKIAGVNHLSAFEAEYKKFLRYRGLKEEYVNRKRELTALLGDRDFLSLKAQVDNIENLDELPDYKEESYRQMQKESAELNRTLTEIEKETSSLETGIEIKLGQTRNIPEIEEELYLALKQKEENELNLNALTIAEETIQKIGKNLHREFAPKLNQEVGVVLQKIIGPKYSQVRISSQLDINVITADGLTRDLNYLSNGTIDQFYFAVRLVIASFLTGNDHLPLFLDESFVQFDNKRLEGVLNFLTSLSAERQIILFTCHQREGEIINRLGIDANIINLS